jgi:hypothetical protein
MTVRWKLRSIRLVSRKIIKSNPSRLFSFTSQFDCRSRLVAVVDPVQKFNKPLTINPK